MNLALAIKMLRERIRGDEEEFGGKGRRGNWGETRRLNTGTKFTWINRSIIWEVVEESFEAASSTCLHHQLVREILIASSTSRLPSFNWIFPVEELNF